jgi:hypothetical protein
LSQHRDWALDAILKQLLILIFFFSLNVYDIGPGGIGHLFQFSFSDVFYIEFKIATAHTQYPETGLFFTFFDFSSLSDKDF